MGLNIQLLGSPRVDRDGAPVEPPRGNKAWGLLAYLLRTRLPPSREHLASLLFPEADDPLGTLRWTLSALRSRLGDDGELGGDPLTLELQPGTFVDVDVLERGSWMEAVALPGLGHELLDGLGFRSSPGFELWLESERRHIAGMTSAVLHQAALALLGRGETQAAAKRASELVRLNPYEENAHVLLVRCLCAAGDQEGAARHVHACTELFRRELGTDPTEALRTAMAEQKAPSRSRVSGRTAVLATLEAGEAALGAGVVETGVHRMREAVVAAREVGDRELLAEALVALGGALVHSARGTDEEGAAALHEGTTLAEQVGRDDIAATGWREISWVQFLRAQYERAEDFAATHDGPRCGPAGGAGLGGRGPRRIAPRPWRLCDGRRVASFRSRAVTAAGDRPAPRTGADPARSLSPHARGDRGRRASARPGARRGGGKRDDGVHPLAGGVPWRARPGARRS